MKVTRTKRNRNRLSFLNAQKLLSNCESEPGRKAATVPVREKHGRNRKSLNNRREKLGQTAGILQAIAIDVDVRSDLEVGTALEVEKDLKDDREMLRVMQVVLEAEIDPRRGKNQKEETDHEVDATRAHEAESA